MGKNGGKAIVGALGFAFGFGLFSGGVAQFGASSALLGGLYGASLGSSLWLATHPQSFDQSSTVEFDQIMNRVDADSRIPIIYGTRKWGGQQTYHKASTDKKSLTKDIVWCESEIEGITDVRVDDISITPNVILSIQNTKYSDAYFSIRTESIVLAVKNTYITLYANGTFVEESIANANLQTIINTINKYLSSGWVASTTTGSESVSTIGNISEYHCYNIPYTIQRQALPGCSYTFSNSEAPDNYSTVGGYKNCAWSRFSLTSSDQLTSPNPTCTAIIKGMKVWDTRTNTKAYSSNPAMCVRDYLLSKRYGAGHFITIDMLDEDSFKEIADYCDQYIATKVPTTLATVDAINAKITELQQYLTLESSMITQEAISSINTEIAALQQSLIDIQSNPVEYTIEITKRYELNIIIAETKSHIEILQDMFAIFGGFLVFCNNKVSLRCEKETPVSYAFTDDTIIEKTLDHTQYPIENSPNRFNVKFYDPSNEWTGVKVVVEDTVNQMSPPVGVGKIVNKEVDLTGCTSQSQALRLARMYRDKIKLCSIVVQFQTATMAMHLEPGDVITVSKKMYPNGQEQWLFKDTPFRVLELSEQKGIYSIKAEQYNGSIYNDSLGAQIQSSNFIKISPVVANVDYFAAYQDGDEIYFYWNPVAGNSITYEIREGTVWDSANVVATNIIGNNYRMPAYTNATKTYLIKAKRSGMYCDNATSLLVAMVAPTEYYNIQVFNELETSDGTHYYTKINRKALTWSDLAALTGRPYANQYVNEYVSDFTSPYSVRLILKDYISMISPGMGLFGTPNKGTGQYGIYTCKPHDMGAVVKAKISPKFVTTADPAYYAKMQYRLSSDNKFWSDWIDFIPRTAIFRYIQSRVYMETTDITKTPEVTTMQIIVSTPR